MLSPTTQTAQVEQKVRLHIGKARERVRTILKESAADDLTVIRRVRVTFPYKFVYLLGAACVLLRDYPEAQKMLVSNMLDELENDHPGMAIRFAAAAGATPTWQDELYMEPVLERVRNALVGPKAHKRAIAVLATLETTSQDFIPDMENRAKRCGSTDLEFTKVHGIADAKHADELCEAATIVYSAEELFDEETLVEGIDIGVRVIESIYSPPN